MPACPWSCAAASLSALHLPQTNRANRRLRQLFDHGYLARSYPKDAPWGAQAVHSVAMPAARLVAACLGLDPSSVRALTRKSPTPVFREHALAIVDVYLALKRASDADPGLELCEWVPELLCRQEYEIRPKGAGRWRKEVFRPDGYYRLREGTAGREVATFVEVDLGHTSLKQYGEKLAGYRIFRESGLYREVFGGDDFTVLVVTTGERRAQHLKSALGRGTRIPFRFATFDPLSEACFFSPVVHKG